jgi:enoyl-CoA hydratase/carnithine racemase
VIESTTKDGVAVLAMRHGKANALDIELCQALCDALDEAAAAGAAAVVLTGTGTVFSAGVDLKRVTAGRQRFLARVHDLAVFDAGVDAIWQAPATLERIQSFMTSLK